MNIIDVQDQLKDFSEQQLIREMQMPSGTAPQFLVLSEIQRRKRMRDDFAKREAAQQKTVAQEAVSAAGVPDSGIAGMSEAMAPKSTMAQNAVGSNMAQAMRSGGLAQFGQELSQKVSSDTVEPFLDEIESMASDRFGVDLGDGSMQRPPFMGRIPTSMPGLRNLFESRFGTSGPKAELRGGGKGGPRPTISNMAVPDSQLGINRFQVVPFNEGGPVIKAQEGRYFSQFDEGDIDLNDILDAMARVESGAAGGQNYFGVPVSPEQMAEVGGVGELSAYQVRPTTLLDFGRGMSHISHSQKLPLKLATVKSMLTQPLHMLTQPLNLR